MSIIQLKDIPSVVLVQAHASETLGERHETGSRSPDLLVVSVSVPAFPCFPVAQHIPKILNYWKRLDIA